MANTKQIILFSLLLQFSNRSLFSNSFEAAYFQKIAFRESVGNSFQATADGDIFQCLLKCIRFPECLSLNIADQPNKDGLYECVLLRNETSEFSRLLRPSQVYHHYTRLVGKCTTSTCMNGGTCEALVNDVRCRCPLEFTGKQCEAKLSCNTPLGLQSGAIVNSSITASSFWSTSYKPYHARLNDSSEWTAKNQDVNQWLQVDLSTVTKVTGIATQGSQNNDEWIESYSLQHSLNGKHFFDYEGGKNFTGNDDDTSIVKSDINPAIIARYIRVRPKTWIRKISLRMELYGCK